MQAWGQKKGGESQIGRHLPGWGGVLLGKLNESKQMIPSRAVSDVLQITPHL
jgi:hypothetical protein